MSEVAEDSGRGTIDLLHKRGMLVVLLGALIAVFVSRLSIDILFVRDGRSTNDVMVFIVMPIIHAALLIGIPFALIRRAHRLAVFDCRWFRWSRFEFAAFWPIPLGVGLSLAITALLMHLFALPISKGIGYEHGDDARWNVAMLVWLTLSGVLVWPLVEEVFWRGYVQSALARFVHPALAIIGQAALFGLIHFRPVVGFVQASLFGLIFGLWCYRRKTLVPVIVMHMAINGVALTRGWMDWSELRQVKVTHDYVAEFLEFSKPAFYDPHDDARAEYARACELVAELPTELDGVRQSYPTQWSQDERARTEAWVASNAEALGVLEEGTAKATYWPEYEFPDRILPPFAPDYLKDMKHLVFAVNVRARRSAVEGRHEDAFADVLTCFRLSEHLGQCKNLTTNLVAMAARGQTAQTIRLILSHEPIDNASLAHLQRDLQGFATRNDFVSDFTGERLWMLDSVQRLFTDDGQGGGHMPRCGFRPCGPFPSVFSDFAEVAGSNIDECKKLDRRATTKSLYEYYRAFDRLTALSPWDYERNADGVKETIERIASENLLIRMFSPNTRIGHITARARVDLDSVITILGVLRYRIDRQQLPESLAELVTEGYLESVPRDPYGPGVLIYRRSSDDFVLYSRGGDFDDDGGTPSKWGTGLEGGDQVFWPVEGGR